MPLAVVHYGMRRLAVPLFLGKFVHNVVLALLFYGFASWSADHVSQKASTELALLVAALFMVLVGLPRREGPGLDAQRRRHRLRGRQSNPRCDRGSNCS